MAGINGIIQFNNEFDDNYLHHLITDMNNKIIYRGPDRDNVWTNKNCALGVCLMDSVEDNEENGPVWNDSYTKIIICDADIYNELKLREVIKDNGYSFRTNSVAEVLLKGYDIFGVSFFSQVEGNFALAIYDLHEQELLLIRDSVGNRPLYYCYNNNKIIFSSELKSLLSTGLVPKEINQEALAEYFQLTYIPAPNCIFKQVQKVPAATCVSFKKNSLPKSETYWTLQISNSPEYKNYEKCKEMLKNALYDSVKQRMRKGHSFGVFLSGGFDSTVVTGVMSQICEKPVNTFTVGFPDKEMDESRLAQLVANYHKTNHTTLFLNWKEVLGGLDSLLDRIDEPFADSSLVAFNAISKKAKQYVDVVLTGDTCDELFAGYNKYLMPYYVKKYEQIPVFVRNGLIKPFVGVLPKSFSKARLAEKFVNTVDMKYYDQCIHLMSLGFKPREIEKLLPSGIPASLGYIDDNYKLFNKADAQTRIQYVDFKTVLEGDMMVKADRGSMYASLVTRAPILDSRIVKLAFSIPSDFRINKKNRKIIFKDTFKDLIPKELFNAPKHGFGVPIGKWLSNELRSQLVDYANSSFLKRQGLFNAEYVKEVMNSHLKNQESRGSELWAFYVFQNWYDRYYL